MCYGDILFECMMDGSRQRYKIGLFHFIGQEVISG
jgi:hypothetical protein